MSAALNFWQAKIKFFRQLRAQRFRKIAHLIKVPAMVMIDPGEHLMNPVGFYFPLRKNFFELELGGSKKVLWTGWGLNVHANRKSFKNLAIIIC